MTPIKVLLNCRKQKVALNGQHLSWTDIIVGVTVGVNSCFFTIFDLHQQLA